ncbi:MAG: hypothetical protein CMA64_07465 [Euryarchaeota archaeon]|nr:hypothetical protein [Euryarchaeota archaeon]
MVKESKKDKDKNAQPKPQQQPMQPGMLMWEAGIMYFSDGFDSQTTKPVIQAIIEKNLMPDSQRPKELTLVVNSPGGQVHSAFALIDTMKGSAIPVKTVGLGMIASCGLLTFMSGHKGRRVITPNTSILSHQYSWGSGGKEHELFARVREFELSTARMLEHYKKCTGLSEKKVRDILLPPEDRWLSAKEAVKYGIADKIVSTY